MNSYTIDLIVEGYFANRENKLKPTIKDKSELKFLIEEIAIAVMKTEDYTIQEFGWNKLRTK